jgi:tRNA (guanine-N7-)-methyltransferase
MASPDYRSLAPRAEAEGPIDVRRLLDEGPRELDLGFGRGLSIFERSRRAPEGRILGIEIKPKWSVRVAERVKKAGLDGRVAIVCGDARDLLPRLGPDGVFERVFVHFPDPWWKKRHARRRLLGGEVLTELARLVAPGGDLYVQTDVEARARDYRALLDAHPSFTDVREVDANPFGSISNRERRAAEDGLPVFRLLARRVTP